MPHLVLHRVRVVCDAAAGRLRRLAADRAFAQSLLGVSCAALICIGTLLSRSTPLATVGMFVVGFVVLFSGIVSSVIASATTPLLLSFILPVTVPGSVADS